MALPAPGEKLKQPLESLDGNVVVPQGATRLKEPQGESGDEVPSETLSARFGVAWSPEEFFIRASELEHPFDTADVTPDRVRKAIFRFLTSGVECTKARRKARMSYWTERARELDEQEKEMHCHMSPELAKVYEGKRFRLLGEMLQSIDYPDKRLVEDLLRGMPIVGLLPPTGAFPKKWRRGTRTVMWLERTLRWARAKLQASTRPDPDAWVQSELEKKTKQEEKLGWTKGPLSEEQVTELLGEDWLACRRFGVVQGDKVRLIDDLSEFFVNATVESFEKVDLGGVDEIASIIRTWAVSTKDGRVKVVLENGKVLEGELHHDFQKDSGYKLLGKCLDLESAYRQVGILEAHKKYCVVAVWDSELKKTVYYIPAALPFGATASVIGFNRASRALACILSEIFDISLSNHFDDYPIVETEALAEDAGQTLAAFFSLVGWRLKDEKEAPFAEEFVALGVVFNMSGIVRSKKLWIANKPERVSRLREEISEILNTGRLRPGHAARLRGKLAFASAQIFGRCGAAANACLGERAVVLGGRESLDDKLRWSLRLWLVLTEGIP